MTPYTTPPSESTSTSLVDKTVFSTLPPAPEKLAFAVPLLGVAVAVVGIVGLAATAYVFANTQKERDEVLSSMHSELQSVKGWVGDQCKVFTDAVIAIFQRGVSDTAYVVGAARAILFSREFQQAAERPATPVSKNSLTQPQASTHAFKAFTPAAAQILPARKISAPQPRDVLAQVLQINRNSFASAAGFNQAKTAFQKVLQAHPKLPADYRKDLARYLAGPYVQALGKEWTKQVKMLEQHPQEQGVKQYRAMQATLQTMQGVEDWLTKQGAPGVFLPSVAERQKQLQAYFRPLPAQTAPKTKPAKTPQIGNGQPGVSAGLTNRGSLTPGSKPPNKDGKDGRIFPLDPYHQKALHEANEALKQLERQRRPGMGEPDPERYAPKSAQAQLIYYAKLAKQSPLTTLATGTSGQNTPAGVSSTDINYLRRQLDETTQKLIDKYLNAPTEINAKALMQHLQLGQTTPEQWIPNFETLQEKDERKLAVLTLATLAPALSMALAIEQINTATSFEMLAHAVRTQAKSPYYPAWVDAPDQSPYLQAIANAFLRLGKTSGLSGGPILPGHAAQPPAQWEDWHYEELAQLILNLNHLLPIVLQQFPLEVLEHLGTHTIYRYSVEHQWLAPGADPADNAPTIGLDRLIFYAQQFVKQKSRRLVISDTGSPEQKKVAEVLSANNNELDEKTQDLIDQYLKVKVPSAIHAKALMQHLNLGQTTPKHWIPDWQKLSDEQRALALKNLAINAPAIEKDIAQVMDLAIKQIDKAQTFEALTQDIQTQAENLYYPAWVDADQSPYLQAIANAFVRLGRQKGWSSGLQLAGEAAHLSRGWQTEYSEELAAIVLRLNKQLLLEFPSEVLEHLKTQVVYRRGLQIYNQRIDQQQDEPLEQTMVPENLGRAVQLLRLVISEQSQPTGKVLPSLTAKSPQNVLKTGMHPKLLTSIIPDIHGNPDLLLVALDVIGEQIAATKSVPGREVNEEEHLLVDMGDNFNKGAASAKVLAIMRLLKAHSNGELIKIPSWLAAKGFAKILQKLGRFKMVLLRGNHEELINYGMPFNAKADISKYSKLSSAVMEKGFQPTVISFLQLYPELLTEQERNWMQTFIKDPPILNKDGKWRTKNSSTELDQNEAHQQYEEFRRIWLALLGKTGDLSLLEDLLPFYIDNNILYVHGGPPENLDGLEALMAYKRDGTPLPPEVARQILWRRLPTELRGPADWANVITAKVIKDNLAQGDKQNSVPIASLPINVFTGHTMGSVLGQYWLSLPNGIQQLMTIVGADAGFGLQNLQIYRIKPNGELTAERVYRTGDGIKTESVNLNGGQPKPGTQGELLNRF